MKLVFCGTSDFSADILSALLNVGYSIPLVLTQPDRPAGRGMKLRPTPVKTRALEAGLTVIEPLTLKDDTLLAQIRALAPDIVIVVAYGLLLPEAFLSIPTKACVNVHTSLLPRWRGAAPIQRALLAGDQMTGVSIMKMAAGLDTGPVYRMLPLPIADNETTGTLTEKLLQLSIEGLCEILRDFDEGRALTPVPQDNAQAIYAAKIDKQETWIDWSSSADDIDRKIRAFNPAPGARTMWGAESFKIWEAVPINTVFSEKPGKIVRVDDDGIIVCCGEGGLILKTIQRAGGKRMSIKDFLRGSAVQIGQQLGA